MPELPEVETVRRELQSMIIAKEVSSVQPVWMKTFQNQCHQTLRGQIVKTVARLGKYIVLELSETALIIHLRMTGQLIYRNQPHPEHDYIRAIVHFADGSALYFKDIRKFGRIYHVCHPEDILYKVGPDALGEEWSLTTFRNVLNKSSMNIKAFLLSQRYISGLGNIYTDESLYRAGIHPKEAASRITAEKAETLYEAIRFILNRAVKYMGSTISDYRDLNGDSGQNQKFFEVYKREGQPCRRCGSIIIKNIIASRSTRICPGCQTESIGVHAS